MADIEITDQLDKPVDGIAVDLSQPSSLVKYLKSELLHLAVLPDFLERKDLKLSQAATKPIQFQAKIQHKFQLGNTKPEIDVTPGAQVTIRANATAGSNLFDGDPFRAVAKVPNNTGYVSVGFGGTLDLGVSGSDGDLTFGFDRSTGVTIEYLKAFPLGANEPTLGNALGNTMSSFVIPSDLSDLNALGLNDIAVASGQGSLKVSGGVKAAWSPNPLASVDLPLGTGTIAVKEGASVGLTMTFVISGSYQVRTRRKDADTIELSFLQEHGTSWKADFSASAGVTAKLGDTDLIASFLGAVSTDPTGDKSLLADLKPAEIKALTEAIKGALDHSLQDSIDLALSRSTDDQGAFQYEIQPRLLTPEANVAVHKALDGDLSLLTAMEDNVDDGNILTPGIKMLNSVLSTTRKSGVTLKVNLLGILNYLSMSELIRHSEFINDPVTGELTIKDTVGGTSINAIVEPLARNEALRQAIYDSVLATCSYRAGKAVSLPTLTCDQVHFALNQTTTSQIMSQYLTWFETLNLITSQDKPTILDQPAGRGASTCVLRTSFDDSQCTSMFLNQQNEPRDKNEYLEIGRQALRALLDPDHEDIDRYRYKLLDDAIWPKALEIGAADELGTLVGISPGDVRVEYLVGDVLVISEWARAMVGVGAAVQDIRAFVGVADPATLFHNNEFKQKRDTLQTKMVAVVTSSKMRFEDPFGMVSLYWAGGSPRTSYGKIVAQKLTVLRGAPATPTAGHTSESRASLKGS